MKEGQVTSDKEWRHNHLHAGIVVFQLFRFYVSTGEGEYLRTVPTNTEVSLHGLRLCGKSRF